MIPQEIIDEWLSAPFDQETQNSVKKLMKYPEKLEDAFYTSLNFGTGGMRGIMGAGTNRINKYTLGKSTQGLYIFLKKKYPTEQLKAVIAYDCRHQSQSLAKIVADVFTANGIYCYLFSELRPTPELSFAVRHLKTHCGIVLTASHNPPEYNGYKVYGKDGGQLVPPDDESLINEIEKTTYKEIKYAGNPSLLKYINHDLDNAYHQAVLDDAKIHDKDKSQIKIVFTPIHGTAITAVPQVLKKAGYKKIFVVKEQEKPNGDFPTVVSPNPEEKEALNLAVELAEQKKADVVFGTDPDSDRFGIVVRDFNQMPFYLNGNQIMVVLTEYILSKKKAKKLLSKNHFIASTIVSTPMIEIIANAYKVKFKSCLTGFKWIAQLIETHPELNFIAGGEESFGYLVGNKIRDKDAVSGILLACELASELKLQGKSMYDFLLECYEKYGIFQERLVSITKKGKAGANAISKLMEGFRYNPPKKIGGTLIQTIEDYKISSCINLKSQQKKQIYLPQADVLAFILEDGSRISLRPSGTEPKIKFYFSVNTYFNNLKSLDVQQKKLDQKIDLFINDLIG
jgi:phosphoglucomutase